MTQIERIFEANDSTKSIAERRIAFDSPYPGLRPFNEEESTFFFGRKMQTKIIITLLESRHTVFVIGGSGSGKSSIVRAGVAAELRGHAIKDAGDYWLPIFVTPGTDHNYNNPSPNSTPLGRVATAIAKCRFLESHSNQLTLEMRTKNILNLLQSEQGLDRVYYTYFAPKVEQENLPTPNLLLVLDQFEELFHPSNMNVDDCSLLVQLIIDHYDQPNCNIYIIATMRTEHLSDCATYMGLPDIINHTAFLVRRLNSEELSEAISAPGARELKILRRKLRKQNIKLPTTFHLEEELLQKILFDVNKIRHDPDHLALLQNLISRLFDAALARSQLEGLPYPETITMDDLDTIQPINHQSQARPKETDNTLRICLDSSVESIFDTLSNSGKNILENILTLLAFKDPKTGSYTQKRAPLNHVISLIEESHNNQDNWETVIKPFLIPMNYLCIDDTNQEEISIKVSHESLVRGWKRFKDIIDEENRAFEEFLYLLHDHKIWKRQDESHHLSHARIKNLEKHKILARLTDKQQQTQIQDLYNHKHNLHDNPSLGSTFQDLNRYVNDSIRHIEKARRIKRAGIFLGMMAIILITIGSYFSYLYVLDKHLDKKHDEAKKILDNSLSVYTREKTITQNHQESHIKEIDESLKFIEKYGNKNTNFAVLKSSIDQELKNLLESGILLKDSQESYRPPDKTDFSETNSFLSKQTEDAENTATPNIEVKKHAGKSMEIYSCLSGTEACDDPSNLIATFPDSLKPKIYFNPELTLFSVILLNSDGNPCTIKWYKLHKKKEAPKSITHSTLLLTSSTTGCNTHTNSSISSGSHMSQTSQTFQPNSHISELVKKYQNYKPDYFDIGIASAIFYTIPAMTTSQDLMAIARETTNTVHHIQNDKSP